MAAVWSGCVSTSGGSAVSEEEVQQLAGTWYVMGQAMILNENGTLSGNWTGDVEEVTKEWSVSDGTLTIMITAAGEGAQNISGPYELSEDGNTLAFTIEGMEEIFTRQQ